jgi:hypothetical protein
MARRPNYGQQRAEINRGKQAKQEAKQREREEAVSRRKAEREGLGLPPEAEGEAGAEPTADELPPQDR